MNIFKKAVETIAQIEKRIIKTSDITMNFTQVIEEIDNIVKNEEEELNLLKTKNSNVLEKVNTLKSLGFSNAKPVKDTLDLQKKILSKENILKENIEKKEYINKYKLMFPGYKFVPENIFTNILKKYGIYNCESRYYINDIPKKNIKDIVLFRENFEHICVIYNIRVSSNDHGRVIHIGKYADLTKTWEYSSRNGYRLCRIFDNLSIAAPLSDFNFGDSEETKKVILDNKNNTVRIENIKVDDPIVNVKVPGGHIIVTAWDKEALDPEILNENNN